MRQTKVERFLDKCDVEETQEAFVVALWKLNSVELTEVIGMLTVESVDRLQRCLLLAVSKAS